MPDSSTSARAPNVSKGADPVVVTLKAGPPKAEGAPARPIFDEDWWLDAACPGAWNRVRISWDGENVGDMAFHIRKRRGMTFLTMPHLTRTLSPNLRPPPSKAATRTMHNATIVGEIMAKLPRYDRFERFLDPECESVQGFVHAGMPVTHMFTFRSKTGDTAEALLAQAHGEARRAITKAQRDCTTERTADLDRFIRLHAQAYGKDSYVDYPTLRRLFEAASSRGQAEIIVARLNDEADTAAMIVIWDAGVAYTWLLARDEVRNYVGATSLLTFEAMKTAQRLGRVLDLDGYVSPQVGNFLTKFGLEPVVRPYVNGSSRLWGAMRAVTTLVKPNRPDRHFRVA
jgi:hypothetical protein